MRSYCKSESLSVEGLHEIIDRYGWTPNNTHHINDYGFFLAACENERVTEGIIKCLLEYFPHATGATDDVGQGPLHCACSNKSLASGNIIQLLIDAAPNSVRSKDNDGYVVIIRRQQLVDCAECVFPRARSTVTRGLLFYCYRLDCGWSDC